ncbi:hypothetical protein IQ238_08235, partial [Pleurocapsales cyanobacterium LEGE 06147]|nr:hypothetical protein [Pleurocapsales cyanobacterium LEGE 06147]
MDFVDRQAQLVENVASILSNLLAKIREVAFVCRLKQDTYIPLPGQNYQSLKSLALKPGMKWYLPPIKLTQVKEFGQGAVVGYWRRKYRGKQEKEAWYLLTNLPSASAALTA